jgi:Kef-type K+ transport system membrane component KefB
VETIPYGLTALTLAVVVPATLLGRRAARLLRQPGIVGEIMACLLAGGLLAAALGPRPHDVEGWRLLETVGHLGLALFLVKAVHEIRGGGAGRQLGRALLWTAAGSALLPMACGALFALWVLHSGDPTLQGDAPAGVLVLMLAISLAVTAVPVLAGIMEDRNLQHTPTGRLAMAVAVTIDAVTWGLLAIAVGIASGGGRMTPYAVFVAGLLLSWAARCAAGTGAARAWAGRVSPAVPVAVTAVVAAGTALGTARLGLTDVLGAVLVALALPADGEDGVWTRAARTVGGWGRAVLPLLFTVTGVGLGAAPLGTFSGAAVLLALALAVAGKLVGSYLGAWLGGRPRRARLQLAALLNARGLTEIAVLQIGYQAGILAPALYLALVVMALVTTAISGPLLWAIDRCVPAATVAGAPPSTRTGGETHGRHLNPQ